MDHVPPAAYRSSCDVDWQFFEEGGTFIYFCPSAKELKQVPMAEWGCRPELLLSDTRILVSGGGEGRRRGKEPTEEDCKRVSSVTAIALAHFLPPTSPPLPLTLSPSPLPLPPSHTLSLPLRRMC
jgi:hypothetical protein